MEELNKTSEEKSIFTIYKDSKKFLFNVNIINIDEEENISIQCHEESNNLNIYEISLNLNSLIQKVPVFKIFEKIKDIFDKFILLFKNNKINIESIQNNLMIISLSVYEPFEGLKKIELDLPKKENSIETSNEEIFKQLKQLKEEISKLKEENLLIKNDLNNEKEQNKIMKEKLMEEINNIKNENKNLYGICDSIRKTINLAPPSPPDNSNTNDILNQILNSDPINTVKIKDINRSTKYKQKDREKVFSAFKTLDNKYYLVYRKNNSIILNNLLDGKDKEISSAHENSISFIKHYLDTRFNDKKDIIISFSNSDKECKIWDINSLNCLSTININLSYEIESIALISKYDNIIVYVCSDLNGEPIKYYNIFGKESNLINSYNQTYYIEIFKDFKNDKNYLISCNKSCVLAFDADKNELYKTYKDFNRNVKHLSAILYLEEDKTKLIEGDEEGLINIWSFHIPILYGKIVLKEPLNEMILWDKNYLLVYESGNINIIGLNESKVIKTMEITDNKNELYSIQKIVLPKLGECLITQNKKNELINLWQIKISQK